MKRILICGILLYLSVFHQLAALPASRILASVAPGTSSEPLMVRFDIPRGTRLALSVNGDLARDYSVPLFLTTFENTEKNYFVNAVLYPLDPKGQILEEKLFYWKIDRKPPSTPRFFINEAEGGSFISITIDEPGTIEYKMFHSISGASGSGSVLSHEQFYLPSESFIVAWGIDSAGNIGLAASPSYSDLVFNKNPCTVVNPVPGTWSNKQALLIETPPNVTVYYSINESDTSINLIEYTGPIVIENEGLVSIHVLAIDAEGKKFTSQILYTVESKEYPEFNSVDTSSAFLQIGNFGEIRIPSGYSYEIDGFSPYFSGDTSLVFSAIRNVERYYPLTLSDEESSWRWICISGGESNLDSEFKTIDQEVPSDGLFPQVHNWNYISFDPSYHVFYSFDKKNWYAYTEPIFVSRIKESTLYWYSSSLKSGEVQAFLLPVRPQLTGIPSPSITSNSVLLSVTESPFSFYVETGNLYYPEKPSVYSSPLSSGLLFEVPSNAESHFTVRVLAMHEGVSHGELYSSFTIDRKPPSQPISGLNENSFFSREAISFTPRGEDFLNITISPPLFRIEKGTYILTGHEDKPIDYSVEIFSQDLAGNKSATLQFSARIDLNALFINSESSSTITPDGSPSAPFVDLDSALDLVEGERPWRLYIQGDSSLNRVHRIDSHVSFFGQNGKIIFGPHASLSFISSFVSMKNLLLVQETMPAVPNTLYPVTRDGFSLIEFMSSTFNARNIDILRSNQFSGAVFSAYNSRIDCNTCVFSINATDYAQVVYIENSSLKAQSCTFSASSRDVSAFVSTDSQVDLENVVFSVKAETAGRGIESWASKIDLNSVIFNAEGKKTGFPVAIWLDKKSIINTIQDVHASGFQAIGTDVSGIK